MKNSEELESLAPEQYGSRASKSADIQALSTRLFYDKIRLKRLPATSVFADLVSNYDLVLHSISSLSLQRVDVPKYPVACTLSTLQDMIHSVRTAYGDSTSQYRGDLWVLPLTPPLPLKAWSKNMELPQPYGPSSALHHSAASEKQDMEPPFNAAFLREN